MRVVIAGAPDVGKTEIAQALFPNQEILGNAENLLKHPLALGQLADYRVELYLATERAMLMTSEPDAVFIGTPLDNLIYQMLRYEELHNSGVLDEAEDVRHYLTASLLYAIFVDSFVADIILWIPQEEETDDFDGSINSFYKEVLEQYMLDHTTLTGSLEEKLEQSRNAIAEWEARVGPQPSVDESSEEESN